MNSGSIRDCIEVTMITERRRLEMNSGSPQRRGLCLLLAGRVLVLLILLPCLRCYGGQVVFFRTSTAPLVEEREVRPAADFYGLSLRTVIVDGKESQTATKRALGAKSTLGVIIDAEALPIVDRNQVLAAIGQRPNGRLPLLIVGANVNTNRQALKTWSGGAVVDVRPIANGPFQKSYRVGQLDGVTRQLSNVEILFKSEQAFSLGLSHTPNTRRIVEILDGDNTVPSFIESSVGDDKVFVAGDIQPPSPAEQEPGILNGFPVIAPALMFIKYIAGETAWHTIHQYANLTIDDAWLREPYGFLSYKNLLAEMEAHDFHTTIAFIPWNYDRSQPEVVDLLRAHPDRFSISVHGDNHDHKEFTDYRTRPLTLQVEAMEQSLARMERFRALTGLSYDRVMIFPHSIAPEATLAALKQVGYLATVNSSNIPMGSKEPSSTSFTLRPVTLSYGNFPSIRRYGAEVPIPESVIAIEQFLNNPLLFYCHQGFFADGISAFDRVADDVNRLDSSTRWRSLGNIVQNLYLIRLRDDADYDVLAFGASISVENASKQEATFHVKKEESGVPTVGSVVVDGQKLPFRLTEGYLETSVVVPAGAVRTVKIQYASDLRTETINVSRDSIRVDVLRLASDVRDIVLWKIPIGRSVVHYYYDHGINPAEVVAVAVACLLFSTLGGYFLWQIILGIRLRTLRSSKSAHQ